MGDNGRHARDCEGRSHSAVPHRVSGGAPFIRGLSSTDETPAPVKEEPSVEVTCHVVRNGSVYKAVVIMPDELRDLDWFEQALARFDESVEMALADER